MACESSPPPRPEAAKGSHEVVVVYRHELFADAIMSLLRARGLGALAVDVRSREVFARVQGMRPRVILVEDNDSDGEFTAKLREILRRNPEVGVIRINVESNRLGIYSARQVMVSGPQDLFDAIDRLDEQPEGRRESA